MSVTGAAVCVAALPARQECTLHRTLWATITQVALCRVMSADCVCVCPLAAGLNLVLALGGLPKPIFHRVRVEKPAGEDVAVIETPVQKVGSLT